ncbi:MAG TPA: tetratricopeptide repeat protein, partial [Candidatus Eremiobacteraceae bacterium]|nr:tetratricopeptide repeat protein [Candidatus Eremiobacteraceae bacterium]
VLARFVDFIRREAREADERVGTRERGKTMSLLMLDRANIRAAIDAALERGMRDAAAQIVVNLTRFWFETDQIDEAKRWTDAILDGPPLGEALQGRLLLESARFRSGVPDAADALRRAQDALAMLETAGDRSSVNGALSIIGVSQSLLGDQAAARATLERARVLAGDTGDGRMLAQITANLGIVEYYADDPERGKRLLEQAMRHYEAIEDEHNVALVLGALGDLAFKSHDSEQALAYTMKSLTIWERLGDRGNIGLQSANVGSILIARGELDAAIVPLRTAFEKFHDLGDTWSLANTLERAAVVAVRRGDAIAAVRMLGYADAVVARSGASRQPHNEPVYQETKSAIAGEIDPETFRREHRIGASMSMIDVRAAFYRVAS